MSDNVEFITDESLFLRCVLEEVHRAREKDPSCNGLMCALTEGVGEGAKAIIDDPWDTVFQDCVQVATLALRVAIEGDPTLNVVRRFNDE